MTDSGGVWKRYAGVNKTSSQEQEMERILSLPLVGSLTPEELDAFCRLELLPQAYESGFRLFPVQAEAVIAYDENLGMFGPIGVGRGKALISLMIASRAFYFRGIERTILFNPPQLIQQLRAQVLPWAKAKVPIRCPFVFLDGKDPKQRARIAKHRRPGCYVMPYSLLSRPDTEDFLEALGADLLIFDEAHYVKAKKRARTRRVFKYINDSSPQTVFLSGTMTQKSIMDYQHMTSASLGARSPVPRQVNIAESWACLIDAGAEDAAIADNVVNPRAALRPLVSWAKRNGLDVPISLVGARRAYRFRLNTAPGVVATPDDEIGVSLLVSNLPVQGYDDPKQHPEWDTLSGMMKQVDERWISPSGDEISQAFHKWRYLDELTAGFYNLLEWPAAEALSARAGISVQEAADRIERAKVHHDALQDYNKILRRYLSDHHIKGLDTPMLVGKHLSKEGAKGLPGNGAALYAAWQEARDLEFFGMPQREGRPVRVSPYKIKHAVWWAKNVKPKGVGALVWYYHQEVGRWLAEAFREAGFDVLHCPAGPHANKVLADIERHKDKVVVLSLPAHSEGKNLQVMQEQFYVQFPRSSRLAQQSIGRTHRAGQEADELIVTKCDTTEFDSLNFAACLVDAAYQHGSGGNRQKLIYASYDPLPQVYPPEFLTERGLEVAHLDETERRLLTEKFQLTESKNDD